MCNILPGSRDLSQYTAIRFDNIAEDGFRVFSAKANFGNFLSDSAHDRNSGGIPAGSDPY
jgi:hypothetical protein